MGYCWRTFFELKEQEQRMRETCILACSFLSNQADTYATFRSAARIRSWERLRYIPNCCLFKLNKSSPTVSSCVNLKQSMEYSEFQCSDKADSLVVMSMVY